MSDIENKTAGTIGSSDLLGTIEPGIPIPQSNGSGKVVSILRKMNVGDSVLVPIGDRMSWICAAKREARRVVTRKMSETTLRVWRSA